ncbi:RbcX chaperonin protein [filamentous cyanobacterium CCP5]|nr:RbcX chaperonin protein [filamentous cyanobacterium CCP5]
MDLKRIAKDTSKVMISYLTFQAVKTVLNQLRETDVPCAFWLNAFSSRESIQDGERYLTALMQERPELALRVMTVRQHIAEEISEYLPEMITLGIQQSNMAHRRGQLERITQMSSVELELGTRFDEAVDSDPATDP